MGSYQDRKDIDNLYSLIWDNETQQLLLLTKDDFNQFKDELENIYYNTIESDNRYSLIGHVHDYTTATEVQEMIDEAITGGQVDLSGYLKKSTATGKTEYTIDELLNEKANSSALTTHTSNTTDAHGINNKANTSDVNTALNGKVDTSTFNSHTSSSSAHSTLFNAKADASTVSSHISNNTNAHGINNKANISDVNQALESKLDASTFNSHTSSSSAHSTLFSNKENTGVASGLVSNHNSSSSAHSSLFNGKEDTGVASSLVSTHEAKTNVHSISTQISDGITSHKNDTNGSHTTGQIRHKKNAQWTNISPYTFQEDGYYISSQMGINDAIDSKLSDYEVKSNKFEFVNDGGMSSRWNAITTNDKYPSALAVRQLVNEGSTTSRYATSIIASTSTYSDLATYYDSTASGNPNAQWLFEHITTTFKSIDTSLSSIPTTYLTKTSASNTYLTQTSASSTYATKSQLTTKQNKIGNMEQVDKVIGHGLIITFHSDGLYVYVGIGGSGTNLTAEGSTTIGTMTNTDYAPEFLMYAKCTPNTSFQQFIRITDNGTVQFLNGRNVTSVDGMNGSMIYPLKSRIEYSD